MLGKAKDMYKLQKQAKQIKKELQNTHIEAEEDGVIVTVNGEQQVISVTISEEARSNNKLGDIIAKCMNKAIKRSQQVAAELMKDVMGNLNFPGL